MASSAPPPSDLLRVLVLDADPTGADPLLHALENNALVTIFVEHHSPRVLSADRFDPQADVIFINPFDWEFAIGTVLSLEKLVHSRDWQRFFTFTRPDQWERRRGDVPWLLMDRQVLITLDREEMQAQVDRIIEETWEAKHLSGRFAPSEAEMLHASISSIAEEVPAAKRPSAVNGVEEFKEADPPALRRASPSATKRTSNSRPSSVSSGAISIEGTEARRGADGGPSPPAGDDGPVTREAVERRLIERRFMLPDEEGSSMTGFREAVQRFQQHERITVDGRLGPTTIARLFPDRPNAYEEYRRSTAASLPAQVASAAQPVRPNSDRQAPSTVSDVQTGEAADARVLDSLPLSTSAKQALRWAAAFTQAANRELPASLALLAGIAASANRRTGRDTAAILNEYLSRESTSPNLITGLGLNDYGINGPLTKPGSSSRVESVSGEESSQVLVRAGEYANRVAPLAPNVPRFVSELLNFAPGTWVEILAGVDSRRTVEFPRLFQEMRRKGFTHARTNGVAHRLDEPPSLDSATSHDIGIYVERRVAIEPQNRMRLTGAVEVALSAGDGSVQVIPHRPGEAFSHPLFFEKQLRPVELSVRHLLAALVSEREPRFAVVGPPPRARIFCSRDQAPTFPVPAGAAKAS